MLAVKELHTTGTDILNVGIYVALCLGVFLYIQLFGGYKVFGFSTN